MLKSSVGICNETAGLHPPVNEVDFTRNCSATGEYWSRFVHGTEVPDGESVALLFRGSLPTPFATMNDRTMLVLGLSALNYHSDTVRMKGSLRPSLQETFNQSAGTCARSACHALGLTGNADIAGTGVSGFIVSHIMNTLISNGRPFSSTVSLLLLLRCSLLQQCIFGWKLQHQVRIPSER